jgi:hypothetical protein
MPEPFRGGFGFDPAVQITPDPKSGEGAREVTMSSVVLHVA